MSQPGTEAPEPRAEPEERPFVQAEQTAATDPVNSQVSAAVSEANDALAGAIHPAASLDQVAAQAAGLAMLNAVNAQQNAYITANATVAGVVARILGSHRPMPPQLVPPEKADHV